MRNSRPSFKKTLLYLLRNLGSVDFRVLLNRFSIFYPGIISTLVDYPGIKDRKLGQNNLENRRTLKYPRGLLFFAAIFFISPLSIQATADWYEGKLEGWYYFEEPSSESAYPKRLEPEEAQELLDLEKKQLEDALALAVIEPTPEHLDEYIASHDRLKLRTERFADQWTQRLEPQKNHRNFLLFCFLGSDPRSKEAAQQSLLIAKEQGLPLKALSLDGQPTLGLDAFEINKGLFEKLPSQSLPSLFLIDAFTHQTSYVQLNLKDLSP